MRELRIATRRSALALAQARRVADLFEEATPGLETRLVEVDTTGDRDQTTSIASLSEVGAFVRSIQQAVLSGAADLAVHSLKDLPVAGPPELDLVAYPERSAPWDVMVGSRLEDLPNGAVVGTGSPRRAAQLSAIRSDLEIVPLRGNVDTRLAKVAAGAIDAAVMAEAGLTRIGRADVIAHRFEANEMVPAPGQGILAVEARRNSPAADLARLVDDSDLRRIASVERLLLEVTGAGCRSALGALARREGDALRLDAFVEDELGSRRAVARGTGDEVVAKVRAELGL